MAETHVALAFEIGRPGFLQILLKAFQSTFRHAEVCKDELVFHRLRITRRIDRAGWMSHRGIVECPDDVDERIGVLVCRDIDKSLGSAGSGRPHEIGELDRRRHALLRVVHRVETFEAFVGHL